MNVCPIFSSFVAEDVLDLDNKKIENYCYNVKHKDIGRVMSNMGGWQSNLITHVEIELKELYELVMSRVIALNDKLGYKNTQPLMQSFWININDKNNYNEVHNHPMSFYAAVYYVRCREGQGKIKFCHPMTYINNYFLSNNVVEYNQFNSSMWEISTKDGYLLIFPSYLNHLVTRNEIDQERISIAFNFSISEIR